MPGSNYTKEEKKVFKAQIKAVKKKLPISYVKIISERTGKNPQVIRNVGSGRTISYEVLEEMTKLAKERSEQVEKLKKELIK